MHFLWSVGIRYWSAFIVNTSSMSAFMFIILLLFQERGGVPSFRAFLYGCELTMANLLLMVNRKGKERVRSRKSRVRSRG